MNYIIAGLPFPLVWAGRALDRQWSAEGVTCKLEHALVDGEPQTLTLQYNGPLAPNTHVVLSGDVANSGLTSGNITATVDNDWSDTSQNF